MHGEQRVDKTAGEIPASEARARAQKRTGGSLEESLQVAGDNTEAGSQPGKLGEGSHGEESAEQYQDELARKRAEERTQAQQEERRRAREEELRRARLAAWKAFMQTELRQLALRKDGQLARLLGEALPGESPAELERLVCADRRQAEEELVTLMSDGKVRYRHVEELSEGDMPARRAAERLRTTWLKERRDGWLGRRAEHSCDS